MLKLFRPKPQEKQVKIKAIIFDIGGVVVNDDYYPFFRKFEKITGKTKEKLYLDIMKGEELDAYERGKLSSKVFWGNLSKKYNIKPEATDLIQKFWPTVLVPMRETITIIKSLRGRYAVGAMSNVGKEMAEFVDKTYDIFRLFDFVILSYKIGFRKPEPEIYKAALKKAKSKPQETVFIDNIFENVEGAQKLGIQAIHFESPQQLERELSRLGIKT